MSRTLFPLRPRRPRKGTEPLRVGLFKGAATATVLAGVLYLATSLYDGIPLRDYGTLYVEAPRVGNLIGHDPVRIAGVRVGQVASISATDDGRARIRVQLEPRTRLAADTTAAIRANGLLGARYLELLPGKAATPLAQDATIRVGEGAMTYGLPEALDVLDARTRANLGATLRELGKGTVGRGAQLNDGIDRAASAIVPFREVAQAILARDGAVERLVPALDAVATRAAESRSDIARLLRFGARALEPLVARRDHLEDSLAALPSTLASTHRAMTRGRRLLVATRRLAVAAQRTLVRAPLGLRSTAALLQESRVPLRHTADLLQTTRNTIPDLTRAIGKARPTVSRLRPTLDELVPMTAEIGPYGCDITNFGLVFRSVTGFGGYGRGPGGPPMQFRLQLVPATPAETIGTTDTTGQLRREGYPAPCRFLGTRYPRLGQPPGKDEK